MEGVVGGSTGDAMEGAVGGSTGAGGTDVVLEDAEDDRTEASRIEGVGTEASRVEGVGSG